MEVLVGIDLGTSSVKVVATDRAGQVVAHASRPYPVRAPAPGLAEQDPADWWLATRAALTEVLGGGVTVAAVGLSGQMHGLVAVDSASEPVRPAIIWPDTRSTAACTTIAERIGGDRVFALTGAPIATGFLAPSLLWLREAEPDAYARVRSVLLPKDYLRLRLTGRLATDPSDASGTLLLDLRRREWSAEIVAALRLDPALLPPIRDAADLAGTVTATAAAQTGLPEGAPVVIGAGDLMAGALSLGITAPGAAAAVIGTGGQLITSVDEPVIDPEHRIQTFAHAVPGRWLRLGAVLAAGQSLDWLAGVVGGGDSGAALADLVAEAELVPPGADGLLFLPYLNGVRTPYVDPRARGCFVGLGLSHGRGHLVRAVLEGVAFAMRECLDALGLDALAPPRTLVCAGGGARLPVWLQIQADVYGQPLRVASGADHSARGAARLAGRGLDWPELPGDAAGGAVVAPDPARQARYAALYAHYRALYPALRPTFAGLQPR